MNATTTTAFGLTIHSELALPGLRTATGAPDILIRRGKVPEPPGFPPSGIAHYQADGTDALAWLDRARLRVTDSKITVDSTDEAFAQQCVVGPGLGVLLHQRGMLVLHGAALDVNGQAVVLLGEKGAGKSTTAAALIARGHRLLTDDLVALDPSASAPTVLPGPTQMKLWPEAIEAIGLDATVTPFFDGLAKGIWAEAPTTARPTPLALVVSLGWGEPEWTDLDGTGAFGALFGDVYAPRFLGAVASASLMRPIHELANGTSVARVTRPHQLESVADLVSRVETQVAKSTEA
ncbi:MAG: hypothetical protein Rubg2KO_35490 [Rubricoccaceae bacterium]